MILSAGDPFFHAQIPHGEQFLWDLRAVTTEIRVTQHVVGRISLQAKLVVEIAPVVVLRTCHQLFKAPVILPRGATSSLR